MNSILKFSIIIFNLFLTKIYAKSFSINQESVGHSTNDYNKTIELFNRECQTSKDCTEYEICMTGQCFNYGWPSTKHPVQTSTSYPPYTNYPAKGDSYNGLAVKILLGILMCTLILIFRCICKHIGNTMREDESLQSDHIRVNSPVNVTNRTQRNERPDRLQFGSPPSYGSIDLRPATPPPSYESLKFNE